MRTEYTGLTVGTEAFYHGQQDARIKQVFKRMKHLDPNHGLGPGPDYLADEKQNE